MKSRESKSNLYKNIRFHTDQQNCLFITEILDKIVEWLRVLHIDEDKIADIEYEI